MITPQKAIEINAAATASALDAIRKQKEKGVGPAFPQARTAAVVAYALDEMLQSYRPGEGEEGPTDKEIIVASLSTGPLMQGSTLQKAAVKAGIYAATASVSKEYDVE